MLIYNKLAKRLPLTTLHEVGNIDLIEGDGCKVACGNILYT